MRLKTIFALIDMRVGGTLTTPITGLGQNIQCQDSVCLTATDGSLRATALCPDNDNQGLAFKLSQLFAAAPDHLELPPPSVWINLTNVIPRKVLMGHVSCLWLSGANMSLCASSVSLYAAPYPFSEANPKCIECEMWHMLFPSDTGND